MKYMKLGSKPDIFHRDGNVISVATELVSDVVFVVEGRRYHLHKFPLLSKCGRFQGLAVPNVCSANDVIDLEDIPGGAEAFELCAKFCYGIVITLSAFDAMAVRCAAAYLKMTEGIEKGNLGFKLEVFLSSSVFRSWKDSILGLQATKALLPWAEDLKLVSRCIDSISSKASVVPTKVDWSFNFTRGSPSNMPLSDDHTSPPCNGIHIGGNQTVPTDWWVEDICDLDIDLYWRVMLAIKSKGRISAETLGEALRFYAQKWLPGVSKDQNLVETIHGGGNSGHGDDFIESASKHKLVLETIVNLLPSERGVCSCSFLLKLLKAANILAAAPSSKMELAKRIGFRLDEASLNDLLIPSLSYTSDSLYDVDLVQCILEHFMMQDQSPALSPSRSNQLYEKCRVQSAKHLEVGESHSFTSAMHSSKLRVAKLIDGYLAEIARDPNLALTKFIALVELIPDFARPLNDGLYRAIDMYLKVHPGLTKTERKRICRLMDCKKLSMDACMHAAQNERLPLRVVVQVLFFEQVRTAMAGGFLMNDLPSNIKALLPRQESQSERVQSAHMPEEGWEAVQNDCTALKTDLDTIKQSIVESERTRSSIHRQVVKHSKVRNLFFHPKKIFSRLWSSMHQANIPKPTSLRSSESSTHTGRRAASQPTRQRRWHSVS